MFAIAKMRSSDETWTDEKEGGGGGGEEESFERRITSMLSRNLCLRIG